MKLKRCRTSALSSKLHSKHTKNSPPKLQKRQLKSFFDFFKTKFGEIGRVCDGVKFYQLLWRTLRLIGIRYELRGMLPRYNYPWYIMATPRCKIYSFENIFFNFIKASRTKCGIQSVKTYRNLKSSGAGELFSSGKIF